MVVVVQLIIAAIFYVFVLNDLTIPGIHVSNFTADIVAYLPNASSASHFIKFFCPCDVPGSESVSVTETFETICDDGGGGGGGCCAVTILSSVEIFVSARIDTELLLLLIKIESGSFVDGDEEDR
ncbi:hypothetical protein DERP_003771 [Dermatophagoides pteronyssinus]|uniref:Uncharacterized protein n=1 Tax=Dermatophagoides pteronyssinus TaxID=6956 RepID=A0ABQ8JM38_DERPT|nr:hypothetical protein DERP_003771 [Dermatophagoides pteronyssinus]